MPAIRVKTKAELFRCCNCHKEYPVTKRRVLRLRQNPMYLWCRCSPVRITGKPNLFMVTDDEVTIKQTRQTIVHHFDGAPTVVNPALNGESKLDICKRLFKDNKHLRRRDVLTLFMHKASCTRNGATTYYYLCKKKRNRL